MIGFPGGRFSRRSARWSGRLRPRLALAPRGWHAGRLCGSPTCEPGSRSRARIRPRPRMRTPELSRSDARSVSRCKPGRQTAESDRQFRRDGNSQHRDRNAERADQRTARPFSCRSSSWGDARGTPQKENGRSTGDASDRESSGLVGAPKPPLTGEPTRQRSRHNQNPAGTVGNRTGEVTAPPVPALCMQQLGRLLN